VSTGEKVGAREAKRIATRERLFVAAVAEFKRSGVADADVATIVSDAGVAHGTFFFHFPTKEHVVAELGQREEVRMAAALQRFLSRSRELSDTLVEVTRMAVALERRLGVVLFKDMLSLYFLPARPALDRWTEHPVIDLIVSEFERVGDVVRVDDGVDPDNGALFFLLGLYGLLITHDRSASRARVLEQFLATVRRGVGFR
jgi:AcrR family transcriptional regulator